MKKYFASCFVLILIALCSWNIKKIDTVSTTPKPFENPSKITNSKKKVEKDINVSDEIPYFYINSVIKDVIENKQEFYSTESLRNFFLKDFRYSGYISTNDEGICGYFNSDYEDNYDKSECEILSFCVIDLDEDGISELMLQLNSSDILVLHYEDELVYGYIFVYRDIANIKTDSTFVGSGGAGYVDVNKIRFSKDTFTYIEECVLNGYDNIYRINGENVTQEEVQAYLKIEYDKQNVEWYDYNANNLSHFLAS